MDLAFPQAQKALEMAREIDDKWTESRALDIIGFAQSVSDPAAAYESLSKCIELGGQIHDSWAETHGIKIITSVLPVFALRWPGEVCRLRTFWPSLTNTEVGISEPGPMRVKGYFARDAGNLEAADAALKISVENAGYVGDPATGGFAKAWSSALKADRGHVEEARQEMRAMMQTATATGTFLAVPGNHVPAWDD